MLWRWFHPFFNCSLRVPIKVWVKKMLRVQNEVKMQLEKKLTKMQEEWKSVRENKKILIAKNKIDCVYERAIKSLSEPLKLCLIMSRLNATCLHCCCYICSFLIVTVCLSERFVWVVFFLVVFIESCIRSLTLGLCESLIVCVCSAIVECHANAREQRSTRTLCRCGANECVCIHAVSCCFCLVALLLCCTDTAPKNQIPHGERVRKSDRREEKRKIFVLWAITMRHTTHMCCCRTYRTCNHNVSRSLSLSLAHTLMYSHHTHCSSYTWPIYCSGSKECG